MKSLRAVQRHMSWTELEICSLAVGVNNSSERQYRLSSNTIILIPNYQNSQKSLVVSRKTKSNYLYWNEFETCKNIYIGINNSIILKLQYTLETFISLSPEVSNCRKVFKSLTKFTIIRYRDSVLSAIFCRSEAFYSLPWRSCFVFCRNIDALFHCSVVSEKIDCITWLCFRRKKFSFPCAGEYKIWFIIPTLRRWRASSTWVS